MLFRILIAGTLLAVSVSASAARLDANLSQDSARFNYYTLVGGSNYGRTEMNAGLLYNNDKNTLWELGIQVIDVAGTKTPGLQIGVGPKVYFMTSSKSKTNDKDAQGLSIALGGNLRYNIPRVPRLYLHGMLYYAPSITSTLDANSFLEVGFRVGYEILPTANVYLGLRQVKVRYTKGIGDKKLDDSAMVGMSFTF